MSLTYHTVAALSELEQSQQMHVQIDEHEILLCREGEQYFAVSYYCSHEAFTLEGGTISNGCITCPYHGAEFNLTSGEALTPPAYEGLRCYPVRVDDETIAIAIES